MTIATIRGAIVDALEGIAGWNVQPYYTDQIVAPQMSVGRLTVAYDIAMGRGGDEYIFTVTAYVSRSAIDVQQALLDQLCEPSGSTSLKTVLETAAVTAAAGADYIRVRSCEGIDGTTVGLADYLIEEFTVEVVP